MSGLEPFIVPSVMTGFKTCRFLWSMYKKKNRGVINDADSKLDSALKEGPGRIEEKWNRLADRLGKNFARGDGMCFKALLTKSTGFVKYLLI
jgi:hypothetical protein